MYLTNEAALVLAVIFGVFVVAQAIRVLGDFWHDSHSRKTTAPAQLSANRAASLLAYVRQASMRFTAR
jgi:hypothetical protein